MTHDVILEDQPKQDFSALPGRGLHVPKQSYRAAVGSKTPNSAKVKVDSKLPHQTRCAITNDGTAGLNEYAHIMPRAMSWDEVFYLNLH